MDQDTLVEEQIIGGREFLEKLQQKLQPSYTITVALWLKTEEGQWYLHIASPEFTDVNIGTVYRTVLEVADTLSTPFDPFRVKLIKITDPIAQHVEALDRARARLPHGLPHLRAYHITGTHIYRTPKSKTAVLSKP
jgi:hypothetical protein